MKPERWKSRNIENNYFTIILLFILFFTLTFTIVPASGNGSSGVDTCSLLTVLSEQSHQYYPVIYGDNVGWIDFSQNRSIHLYNISKGDEAILISSNIPADGMIPAIYDHHIAWTHEADSGYALILYDMITGEEMEIAGGNGIMAWNPDLGDGTIVWEDNREGSFDIFLKNTTSGEEVLLTPDTDGTDQSNPKISGDMVVWQSLNPDTYAHDIYLHSLIDGNTTLITPGMEGTDERHPAIDGNYVVYQGMNPDTWANDIFLFNISSGETILLTPGTEEYYEEYPDIHDGKIVWVGQNPDDFMYDLYLYDMQTGSARLVERCNNQTDPGLPAIYRNRIVWQQPDPVTEYSDIYMVTLGVESPQLVAHFSADTSLGGVPLQVNFTDSSSGNPSGWLWDFGDGTTSAEQNPEHTYTTPGTYDVSLIIHTPLQRSGMRIPGYIFAGSPPVPDFTVDRHEGVVPLHVCFEDQSTGSPEAYFWDFGDGTTSTEKNPEHTYTLPGNYKVEFTSGNTYGNTTVAVQNCVMVMNGKKNTMMLDIPGISCEWTPASQVLTINSTQVQVNPIDNSSLEALPGSGFGITSMNISFQNGYAWIDPASVSGILSELLVTSPPLSYGGDDYDGSLRFQVQMKEYPENSRIITEVWKNGTPTDYEKFTLISIIGNTSGTDTSLYSGVCGVAFTARFECENISGAPPGVLLFAIDSDWIEKYGWRWPVPITSDPAGAFVYVDGNCIGTTPLVLPSDLSAGNHTITIHKNDYVDEVRNVTLEEKRDSIRVIRVTDDGSGEILAAEFLSHDPVNNLDYFRVESPHGFSTFGAVSVSKAGNPIQILFLSLQELLPKLLGGAGGGGGGSSLSASAGQYASSPTTISITNKIPEEVHTISDTIAPSSTPKPEMTAIATLGSEETPEVTPVQTKAGEVLPPMPFTLIQSIAIVFGVILVVSVLLLRWQKGGEQF